MVFPYFGGHASELSAEANQSFLAASLSYASRLELYITYGIHCTAVQKEKHVLCRHVPQNHVTGGWGWGWVGWGALAQVGGLGWGGVGCHNVPCTASTSWSAWGGGGGVGWGAITFLALHPRLGQHGGVGGGGVGCGGVQ